jgi:hypothetical protein
MSSVTLLAMMSNSKDGGPPINSFCPKGRGHVQKSTFSTLGEVGGDKCEKARDSSAGEYSEVPTSYKLSPLL